MFVEICFTYFAYVVSFGLGWFDGWMDGRTPCHNGRALVTAPIIEFGHLRRSCLEGGIDDDQRVIRQGVMPVEKNMLTLNSSDFTRMPGHGG